MSFLSSIAHLGADVAAPVVKGVGAITNNQSISRVGANIASPNAQLSNVGGLFSAAPAFNVSSPKQSIPQTSAPTIQTAVQGDSGNYTNSGGGGIDPSSGYSYNYLQSLANGQLSDLDQQAQVGNQNILDAYNTQLNSLNGSNAQAKHSYDQNAASTLQDYVGARGNAQAQVGQQANAFQRLLGAHGYQGSANTAAAYAAALQGTAANNSLQNQYAKNQQSLDQNFGNYQQQFQNQLGSLGQQKQQQQNALQAQIASTKSGLLQQLAGIASAQGGNAGAYTNQINQLGQQVTALGQNYANPVIAATPPVYQAPSLASYTAPTQQAAAVSSDNAAAANVNPYLSVLLAGQDKSNPNNIPA